MKKPISEDVASLDPYLSTTAFAEYMHANPNTIRRWIKEGKLKPDGATPNGDLRIRQSTGDRLLAEGLEVA